MDPPKDAANTTGAAKSTDDVVDGKMVRGIVGLCDAVLGGLEAQTVKIMHVDENGKMHEVKSVEGDDTEVPPPVEEDSKKSNIPVRTRTELCKLFGERQTTTVTLRMPRKKNGGFDVITVESEPEAEMGYDQIVMVPDKLLIGLAQGQWTAYFMDFLKAQGLNTAELLKDLFDALIDVFQGTSSEVRQLLGSLIILMTETHETLQQANIQNIKHLHHRLSLLIRNTDRNRRTIRFVQALDVYSERELEQRGAIHTRTSLRLTIDQLLRNAFPQLTKAYRRLKSAYEQLKDEGELQLEQAYEQLKHEAELLSKEAVNTALKEQKLRTDNASKKKGAKHAADMKEKDTKIQELESDLASMQADFKETSDAALKEKDTKIQELESDLESLQADFKEMSDKFDNMKNQHHISKQDFNKKFQKAVNNEQTLQARLHQAEATLRMTEEIKDKTVSDLFDREAKLSDSEAMVRTLMQNSDQASDQQKKTTALMKEIEAENLELKELIQQRNRELTELMKQKRTETSMSQSAPARNCTASLQQCTISVNTDSIPEDDDSIPEAICPIGFQPIQDAVMAADGQTYDREYIEMWFQKCFKDHTAPSSPITGEPLAHLELCANHGFKNLLEALRTVLAEKDTAVRELEAAIEHEHHQKTADAKALKQMQKKHSSEVKEMQRKHTCKMDDLKSALQEAFEELDKAKDDQKLLQSNVAMLQNMLLRQPAGADAEAPAAQAAPAKADVAAHSPQKSKGRKFGKCKFGKKCNNPKCKFLHD